MINTIFQSNSANSELRSIIKLTVNLRVLANIYDTQVKIGYPHEYPNECFCCLCINNSFF